MSQNRNKYEFIQQASLSQKLSYKQPEFADYAGSDPQISTAIANLNIFIEFGFIDGDDKGVKLILALLNEQRKALFATSERVNEITKMGLMMPRDEGEVDGDVENIKD